uniref:Uncharacterized protein n=1 Tax=Arundo donax TaxID=35708 RepID=A0A0A8ZKT2_ARUDO
MLKQLRTATVYKAREATSTYVVVPWLIEEVDMYLY